MTNMYEIISFEYNDIYDSDYVFGKDEAIETFIKHCKRYVNPEYISKENVSLSTGYTYICYADRSGGDKPMMVLMTGTFTGDMLTRIREALDDLYFNKCEKCDEKISLEWTLCEACRNTL